MELEHELQLFRTNQVHAKNEINYVGLVKSFADVRSKLALCAKALETDNHLLSSIPLNEINLSADHVTDNLTILLNEACSDICALANFICAFGDVTKEGNAPKLTPGFKTAFESMKLEENLHRTEHELNDLKLENQQLNAIQIEMAKKLNIRDSTIDSLEELIKSLRADIKDALKKHTWFEDSIAQLNNQVYEANLTNNTLIEALESNWKLYGTKGSSKKSNLAITHMESLLKEVLAKNDLAFVKTEYTKLYESYKDLVNASMVKQIDTERSKVIQVILLNLLYHMYIIFM